MNQIYIHVGAPKTGTSAFQLFLYENQEFLSKNKITYFRELIPRIQNNHWTFFSTLREYKAPRDQKYVSKVVADIANDVHEVGILSAEGLSFWISKPDGFRYFIESLKKRGIACTLIAVLRPPLDHLISAYGEDVFAGNSPLRFWEWLDSPQGIGHKKLIYNIKRWEPLVGAENIIWLAYEPVQNFPNKILKAVIGQASFSEEAQYRHPALVRQSQSGDRIEIFRRINALFLPKYSINQKPPRIIGISQFIHKNIRQGETGDHERTFQVEPLSLAQLEEQIGRMTQEANALPFANAQHPFAVLRREAIVERLYQKLGYHSAYVSQEEHRIAAKYEQKKAYFCVYNFLLYPIKVKLSVLYNYFSLKINSI